MHKSYSIMFIGGGRRLELAQLFEDLGIGVVGYEYEDNTPLSANFPVINGLKWEDPNILNHITEIKNKYNINWLLPLQDEATFVLSKLNGCVVSSPAITNELCWDKVKFSEFIIGKFPDIWPFSFKNGMYPVIYKPRFGFGSKNISVFNSMEEEATFTKNNVYNFKKDDFITQRYIKGQEWTIDSYVDKAGKCVGCVPRKRLRVSGGEVVDAITEKNTYLEELTRRIVIELGIRGPCCVQFIQEENSGNYFIMECNARFGGGAPLSIFAGFNMVKMIKDEYFENKEVNPQIYQWRNNSLMRRTFQSCYFFC